MSTENELLDFFKALADPSRLKIVGLLAKKPCTVEELAAILDLRASTISHHLGFLKHVGLVSARAEGYYNVYQLEQEVLQEKSRLLGSVQDLDAGIQNLDLDAYDRKVIADFSHPDGSLKDIPAQRKKLDILLRHIIKVFEPGMRYSEKQVNTLLEPFHEDTATLRRELIGRHLMERESDGREYWRMEK